ncbi:rod shape-determining protein RodA [Natronospira bacteriovora]|uniref:Peptidoglycan glycosyltransferase MrdB n=1 Tax=Natronospira bacteriovora TaxID=3069753 RepID=A0ABU0W473_9GAMM|nr:rod shape-determining protein RodA [Natronospira sp. AB-CW4]MDQ2068759.1 rod shape-determining protein RodA [Natronospira sp. AB-CW4]
MAANYLGSTLNSGGSSGNGVLSTLRLDGPLLLGLLILCCFGLTVVYSASGEDTGLLLRQLIRMGLGLAVLVTLAQIPPSLLRAWSPWVFLGVIALLLLVLIMGEMGKGAQRWLSLGFIRFQPSEMMKLAMPLALAWYLHDRHLPPRWWQILLMLFAIAVPVALIARQPDLGTALLVASAGFFVLFLAGLRWRYMIGGLFALAAALPVLWSHLHDYQRQRVLTFLNPESDPLGAGYHIIQSKIAIGSGGFFGKGWTEGTQSQLQFLPERSTDFIFAVLGEEFGLLGVGLLILIYLFVFWRGMVLALRAQDNFGRLLGGSLMLTFFVYIFVNTGMVTGLVPVVGVPLPLVSYGGTSMVTLMAGFGILMSINSHRRFMS